MTYVQFAAAKNLVKDLHKRSEIKSVIEARRAEAQRVVSEFKEVDKLAEAALKRGQEVFNPK